MRNPYLHLVLILLGVGVLALVHAKGSEQALSINLGAFAGYVVGVLAETIRFD